MRWERKTIFPSRYKIKHIRLQQFIDEKYDWESACPEDAFVHAFSFLGVSDLSHLVSVSKKWKAVAYDISLWIKLDLSKVWWKVNDALAIQILSSDRFEAIEYISLEGCIEITDKTIFWIVDHCKMLKVLLLTNCSKVSSVSILDLSKLLTLEILELDGALINKDEWNLFIHFLEQENHKLPTVMKSFNLAVRIHQEFRIKMPLFWKRTCSVLGLELDTGERMDITRCRHATPFQNRACWGVHCHGTLVYSNQFYHLPGNYPSEILYSCRLHRRDDHKDPGLYVCDGCSCFFREESMKERMCNVCYDYEILNNKQNWINLKKKSVVHDFKFSDILSKSIKMASSSNLPHTLSVYGSASCRLTCRIQDDVKLVDPHQVSVDLFMSYNERRMRQQVRSLKESLKNAKENGENRVLLHVDVKQDVVLMADKHPITDGKRGNVYLKLTMNAWRNALGIIYAFFFFIFISTIFVCLLKDHPLIQRTQRDVTWALLQDLADPLSPMGVAVIISSPFLGLISIYCCIRRFPEQCIKISKLLNMFSIWYIMASILFLMLSYTVNVLNITSGMISALIITWNISAVGVYSLYNAVPSSLHFFFVSFFFIVADIVMVIGMHIIHQVFFYIVLLTVCLYAVVDIVSRNFPPAHFFRQPSVSRRQTFPQFRILFNRVVMSPLYMYWAGLVVSLFESNLTMIDAVALDVILIASLCLAGFVSPIFGKNGSFRPMLFAAFLIIAFVCLMDPFSRFNLYRNFLSSTAAEIPSNHIYRSSYRIDLF